MPLEAMPHNTNPLSQAFQALKCKSKSFTGWLISYFIHSSLWSSTYQTLGQVLLGPVATRPLNMN